DDDGLPEVGLQGLRREPGHDVGRAAGGKRRDDLDHPVRKGFAISEANKAEAHDGRQDDPLDDHVASPVGAMAGAGSQDNGFVAVRKFDCRRAVSGRTGITPPSGGPHPLWIVCHGIVMSTAPSYSTRLTASGEAVPRLGTSARPDAP